MKKFVSSVKKWAKEPDDPGSVDYLLSGGAFYFLVAIFFWWGSINFEEGSKYRLFAIVFTAMVAAVLIRFSAARIKRIIKNKK
ncbi:hypothetical protein [Actinopolyspora xinjiangensis]|uniref:hypothetical protein n=1 Tax=Actinopolyspora xinjiangensis TaxID=405564 RepID=UPI0011142C35|nr:hypothetical protein [Actinopolyspora xinjiangensis]